MQGVLCTGEVCVQGLLCAQGKRAGVSLQMASYKVSTCFPYKFCFLHTLKLRTVRFPLTWGSLQMKVCLSWKKHDILFLFCLSPTHRSQQGKYPVRSLGGSKGRTERRCARSEPRWESAGPVWHLVEKTGISAQDSRLAFRAPTVYI